MHYKLPVWSAIIPTYGEVGLDLTVQAMLSLAHCSSEAHEIIVVDDGSDGNVQERLHEYCERCGAKFIARSQNGGFAKAVNAGLKVSNGVINILFNNDVQQIGRTCDNLANFALYSGSAVAGCKLLYPDGSIQHGGVCYVPAQPHGYWDHIGRHEERYWAPACRIRPGLCSGAVLAIHRNALHAVGLLDERYGMAVEDIDFQLRCMETNMRIIYCGIIEAYHHEGRTRGNTPAEKAKHAAWTEAEQRGMEFFFERWKGVEFSTFQLGGKA